jgi:flagellar protein FlaI
MNLGRRKKSKSKQHIEDTPSVDDLFEALQLQRQSLADNFDLIERYPLKSPFSYAQIVQDKTSLEHLYLIDEIALTKDESHALAAISDLLNNKLLAPDDEESHIDSFRRQLPEILQRQPKLTKSLSPVAFQKISYYLERDLVGFGKIDSLMLDPYIEDISCNGVDEPIYLWHRSYENIKTNVMFNDDEELDTLVVSLVHKAGKHVSTAYPMVDATLPGKHRLAVLYGKEVTPRGTSFTIRKFRDDPLTIIDLIQNDTISLTVAAYLWMLVENKLSTMIIGATGAGKTTALNAVAGIIHPQNKVITVEEVAEINLLRDNWISTISRSGFGIEHSGEIPLFDLVKSAVRHRPDWIIVGEIRGDEAYVLFQALATGHGGLCTMHAEEAGDAMKRLTQPPMNIPSSIIPLMHCMVSVKHVKAPALVQSSRQISRRKFVTVVEIERASRLHTVFRWDNVTEIYHEDLENSFLFAKIADKWGRPVEYVYEEFERRKEILQVLMAQGIRSYVEIAQFLNQFYNEPQRVFEQLMESK